MQIEHLLRLAAVDAATGNQARPHVYLRYWRTLTEQHGLALSESNANLVVTCLSATSFSRSEPVDDQGERLSLRTAVAVWP